MSKSSSEKAISGLVPDNDENNDENNNENIESNWNEKVESFDSMDLKEDLLRGIFAIGFEKPSEIQQLGIKPITLRRDFIGQARSGTGKTGTFGISVLQIIDIDESNPLIQAIILAPVRELAEQIYRVLKSLGEFLNVKIGTFVGGSPLSEDIKKLENGLHVVVGTPGRVQDLIRRKKINLDYLKIFVLDEADEMFTKGFSEQINTIFKELDADVQIAMFSATVTKYVKLLFQGIMKDPIKIYIPTHEQTLDGIHQFYVELHKEEQKISVIFDLYKRLTMGTTIIFCNKIDTVEELTDILKKKNFPVSSLHGGMEQSTREEKIKELRSGSTRLLITTDILARGIDVQQLSMVMNYDLPIRPETYIHRIGRCGRYGRKGIAINLITRYDIKRLQEIEEMYKIDINKLPENFSDCKI